MSWDSWATITWISAGAFVLLALTLEITRKQGRIVTARNILITGTLISSAILLFPIYRFEMSALSSIFLSIHHATRLFAFDDNFFRLIDRAEGLTEYYMFTLATFYIAAPLMSLSVIISLFKNLVSYLKFKCSIKKDVHIFSELNEKTLCLGKSIDDTYNRIDGKPEEEYKRKRQVTIVYADYLPKNEENHLELLDGAKEINAILFQHDLTSINFHNWRIFKRVKRKIYFYLISDMTSNDETEKMRHAESLIRNYRDNKYATLFYFSDSIESKCFFDSYSREEKDTMKMQVARINDVRALIYHDLNDNGITLFENANLLEDGTREIHAVVVGLGKYGLEISKALLWYCQLPGYRIKLSIFDEQPHTQSMFQAICPEIATDETVDTVGDMRYTVHIETVMVGTEEFYAKLEHLQDISYLFVCLGTDHQNMTATLGIRNRLAQINCFPQMETIIYDTHLKERLTLDRENERLRIIGDLKGFYSEGSVINSELIQNAIKTHMRWDTSDNAMNNFFMNDYNYCSSMASALHRNLRKEILSYEKDKETVFPFYYSQESQRALVEANMNSSNLKAVFPFINDNDDIKELSERMVNFADCVYIKLAHIHYSKLPVNERKLVLAQVKADLSAKGIDVVLPMEADAEAYINGYETFVADIDSGTPKKALRKIFDAIIKIKTESIQDSDQKRNTVLSFEYDALTETEKEDVRMYVINHIENMTDQRFYDYLMYAHCFAHIEHVRWNAYMRTEGFRHAIETSKKYKLHQDLVPSDKLTLADCVKDI